MRQTKLDYMGFLVDSKISQQQAQEDWLMGEGEKELLYTKHHAVAWLNLFLLFALHSVTVAWTSLLILIGLTLYVISMH